MKKKATYTENVMKSGFFENIYKSTKVVPKRISLKKPPKNPKKWTETQNHQNPHTTQTSPLLYI